MDKALDWLGVGWFGEALSVLLERCFSHSSVAGAVLRRGESGDKASSLLSTTVPGTVQKRDTRISTAIRITIVGNEHASTRRAR